MRIALFIFEYGETDTDRLPLLYIAWIDISLIVTPSFLPLLFQCLATPQANIRLASAELLFELVAKGMSPTDKLELLRILNVSDIVSQLVTRDDERKKSGVESEQDELYREKLGRVLNVLGLEFTRIIDEVSFLWRTLTKPC